MNINKPKFVAKELCFRLVNYYISFTVVELVLKENIGTKGSSLQVLENFLQSGVMNTDCKYSFYIAFCLRRRRETFY